MTFVPSNPITGRIVGRKDGRALHFFGSGGNYLNRMVELTRIEEKS